MEASHASWCARWNYQATGITFRGPVEPATRSMYQIAAEIVIAHVNWPSRQFVIGLTTNFDDPRDS